MKSMAPLDGSHKLAYTLQAKPSDVQNVIRQKNLNLIYYWELVEMETELKTLKEIYNWHLANNVPVLCKARLKAEAKEKK